MCCAQANPVITHRMSIRAAVWPRLMYMSSQSHRRKSRNGTRAVRRPSSMNTDNSVGDHSARRYELDPTVRSCTVANRSADHYLHYPPVICRRRAIIDMVGHIIDETAIRRNEGVSGFYLAT